MDQWNMKMVLFSDIFIHTTDAFLKGISDEKSTAYVLLDMSKAVDHKISYVIYNALALQPACQNGLTDTLQIDIKLYEFTVPFLILFQLNVVLLKVVF